MRAIPIRSVRGWRITVTSARSVSSTAKSSNSFVKPEDVAHVDAEEFAVFEGIQRGAPIGIFNIADFVGFQRLVQLTLQLWFGLDVESASISVHDREEVGILHAQKILPEEIADAKQTCQSIQHIWLFNGGDFIGPVGTLKELGKEFAKVQQRSGWVG